MNSALARAAALNRREFLATSAAGALILPNACGFAADAEASDGAAVDPVSQLVRWEVRLAEWIRAHRDPILQAPPGGNGPAIPWADYGFKWPAYTLMHLWSTRHADNPLFQAEWCPELAMRLYDQEVDGRLARRGRGINTWETPHYVAAYLFETLGDKLAGQRRRNWIDHEEAWAAQAMTRPLFRTGNYHDSWRFTGLYRLGEAFDRPEWRERGIELFNQMLKAQAPEGFWVEQRGPSFRYHGLMLPSLAWMYRWTGDAAFRTAAERLADFATRYVHPDGTSVGPFDCRNCNVLAYFPTCAGLELTPSGRAFAARAFKLWREVGAAEDITRVVISTRDLPRFAFYVADTARYLGRYGAGSYPDAPSVRVASRGELPVDRDGVIENHSPRFDGVLVRRGAWSIAISGQDPNYSREAASPFHLEGQSRLELWHEKARLTIGGGHSHRDWPIPIANAFLVTDQSGDGDFGVPDPKLLRPQRIDSYMPRAVAARVRDGVPELTLTFPQGTVRYRIHVRSDAQVDLVADWQELDNVQALCLQVPLVVPHRGELLPDARAEARRDGGREVRSEVLVRGGPFDARFRLEVPRGLLCRVHGPIKTGVGHANLQEDDPIENWFSIALVSSRLADPPRSGQATFRLSVET
ncbi:MAG: hypothetical protein WD069_07660 [Planctomycetales bacterium]